MQRCMGGPGSDDLVSVAKSAAVDPHTFQTLAPAFPHRYAAMLQWATTAVGQR